MHRARLLAACILTGAVAGCATQSTTTSEAKRDVEAVVVDEKARAAAAAVAQRTGDAEKGVAVADDVSTREPATSQ